MSLCARQNHSTPQCKSGRRTAAVHDAGLRFAIPLHIGEAFGVRLSFLALFDAVIGLYARGRITPLRKVKAAEGQPHSTTLARGSQYLSIWAKLLECACL